MTFPVMFVRPFVAESDRVQHNVALFRFVSSVRAQCSRARLFGRPQTKWTKNDKRGVVPSAAVVVIVWLSGCDMGCRRKAMCVFMGGRPMMVPTGLMYCRS